MPLYGQGGDLDRRRSYFVIEEGIALRSYINPEPDCLSRASRLWRRRGNAISRPRLESLAPGPRDLLTSRPLDASFPLGCAGWLLPTGPPCLGRVSHHAPGDEPGELEAWAAMPSRRACLLRAESGVNGWEMLGAKLHSLVLGERFCSTPLLTTLQHGLSSQNL